MSDGEFVEFDITQPEGWRWTAMIMQPDHITEAMFREGLEQLSKKKPGPGLTNYAWRPLRKGYVSRSCTSAPICLNPLQSKR
jgi:hypothetical protein